MFTGHLMLQPLIWSPSLQREVTHTLYELMHANSHSVRCNIVQFMPNFMLSVQIMDTVNTNFPPYTNNVAYPQTNGHRRTCLVPRGQMNDSYSSKLSLKINKQVIRGERKIIQEEISILGNLKIATWIKLSTMLG